MLWLKKALSKMLHNSETIYVKTLLSNNNNIYLTSNAGKHLYIIKWLLWAGKLLWKRKAPNLARPLSSLVATAFSVSVSLPSLLPCYACMLYAGALGGKITLPVSLLLPSHLHAFSPSLIQTYIPLPVVDHFSVALRLPCLSLSPAAHAMMPA